MQLAHRLVHAGDAALVQILQVVDVLRAQHVLQHVVRDLSCVPSRRTSTTCRICTRGSVASVDETVGQLLDAIDRRARWWC